MRNSTVATQIAIPPVIFFIQAHFQHTLVQNVQTFFTLGATNDLTDARSQNVHSRNGFTIFVEAHIERFNIFRIVFNHYRCFKVFFRQITLMLRREIDAPVNRVFKLPVAVFENGHCVGVIHLREIGLNEAFQT